MPEVACQRLVLVVDIGDVVLVVEKRKRQIVLVYERGASPVRNGHDASDSVPRAELTECGQYPVPSTLGVGVRVGGAFDHAIGPRSRLENTTLGVGDRKLDARLTDI